MSASLWSGLTVLFGLAGWAFNYARKQYLQALTLPDGSPTIDEYVTRPILEMARTCSVLCQRIYERSENLHTLLEVDGWQFDQLLHSKSLSAVCAIVFRDDGPAPSAIVVWRGTNLLNRRQIRANRKVARVKCTAMFPSEHGLPWCPELPGLVHQGLKEQFKSIDYQVMRAILQHVRAGRKVYVTGHSQGGGLAALTVAAMRGAANCLANTDLCAAGLITFGSMRPGDATFCRSVSESVAYDPNAGEFGVLRFRNNNDIVPLVPPLSSGYDHAGEELYIWPNSVVTRNPGWPLKLLQRLKPLTEGVLGDGLHDHSIAEYCRHLRAVRIPEV